MNLSDTDLDALWKRLHLANARRIWRDLLARADKQDWGYRNLLVILAAEEVAHRQQTRPSAPLGAGSLALCLPQDLRRPRFHLPAHLATAASPPPSAATRTRSCSSSPRWAT